MLKNFLLGSVILFCFAILFDGRVMALNCNCDVVLDIDNGLADGNNYNYKPGDTLCIDANQKYSFFRIRNFHGKAGNKITIINCGGQVKVGPRENGWGIYLNDNSYFRFTGTGDSRYKYGFYIDSVKSTGVTVSGQTHHFELDHVESGNNALGFHLMNKFKCDQPQFWKENFVMKNVLIHNNYAHDIEGEGFYLGYSGKKMDCDGRKVEPWAIENIEVFNNKTNRTGWDGLQLGNAVKGVKVFNNLVKNFGLQGKPTQDDGIVVNNNSTGEWFNNIIIDGKGGGISILGKGHVKIYNNVISRVDKFGIFVGDRADEGDSFEVYNNTIVEPMNECIIFYSSNTKNNQIINNLLVDREADFFKLRNEINVNIVNNLKLIDQSKAFFVDSENNNYRISKNSPAINSGKNLLIKGIVIDADGMERPQDGKFDIGAYEF